MYKTLIVSPGRGTRGGITNVVHAMERSFVWKKWDCIWIETYTDKNFFKKIKYFIQGCFNFFIFLPQCTMIHIHLSWQISALRKSFFFIISRIFHKKIIIHVHSAAEPIIEGNFKFIYRYLFKNADLTIFLADSIMKNIKEKYAVNNSVVLYNPCSISTQIVKCNIEHPYILFAGTIIDKKGTYDLVYCFNKLREKYTNWKLFIAGNGETEKLNSMIQSLGADNCIQFKGWVTGTQKDDLFKNASIFCLPSYTEGFPMAILEAWSFGLPVITTPVGGLSDIIIDNENSLIQNPGDVIKLTSNLERLMVDEHLRNKISKASYQLSKEVFNIESISSQLDKIYSSITA